MAPADAALDQRVFRERRNFPMLLLPRNNLFASASELRISSFARGGPALNFSSPGWVHFRRANFRTRRLFEMILEILTIFS
jgi:hypothetical protein